MPSTIRAMKTGWIALIALFPIACGGSQKSDIKTAEDRLNEQIAIAEESKGQPDESLSQYEEALTDTEKAAHFDKDAAKHELKRAALNASDCPNTFEQAQLAGFQPGTATVTVTFENTGSVKDVSVSSPYDGTPVGDCILRAMGTVHIEPYTDPEVTTTWDVELKTPKKK